MLRLSLLSLFLVAAGPATAQPFTFDEALRGGGSSSDTGEGIALAADGSRTVVGTFEGTATFGNLSITSAGDSDFFLVKYDADGEAVWARRGGTDVFNDFGTATAIAPDGSVYATGFFTGIATFDGGTNPDAELTTFSDFDVFLVKYDPDGDLQWVRQAGGVEQDTGRDLAIDADGNVYLTGGFEGTGTFGTVLLTSAGSTDAFLAKYDPDGDVLWARRGGSDQGDLAYGVAVTADGAAHLSGSFRGVAQFGSLPVQSAGSSDVFVVQYDTDGEPVWVESIGADGSEFTRGGGIGLGPDGSVYVQGSFSNTILVGSDVLVSTGFTDIFVAKLDADGNELWGRRGGGDGTNFSAALAVDLNGNALAVGYADGTGTFDDTPITTQGRDGYFAVFDAEGELVTVELLGGTGQDAAAGVAVSDALGRFAATGSFRDTATFGDLDLTSAGSNDVFILGGPTGAPPPTPSVLFVDADATGAETGLSWADAFTDLQDALALADTLDADSLVIWVAEGTYYPTDDGDRTVSFELQSGLALYGSFDGTETSLDERNLENNATVLSGNIGAPADSTDNSFTVVSAQSLDEPTIFDGFTIASGTGGRRGAGLSVTGGTLSVRASRFVSNVAEGLGAKGGGLYAEGAVLTLTDVEFFNNRATGSNASGGGLYLMDTPLTITDFVFSRNRTSERGGGAYIEGNQSHIANGTFENNRTIYENGVGGGLYVENAVISGDNILFFANFSPVGGGLFGTRIDVCFKRVVFEENRANSSLGARGAGIAFDGNATLIDADFMRNVAVEGPLAGEGGALYIFGAKSEAIIIGSRFFGNYVDPSNSSSEGGAVYVERARAMFINSLVVGNRARRGSAVRVTGVGARFDAINTTFVGNPVDVRSALDITDGAESSLQNAILWRTNLSSGADVSHTIIEGGYDGSSILDADPLFVRLPDPGSDGEWGTEDDDYGDLRLLQESPAVDFGLAEFLPPDTFDLNGNGDTKEALPIDVRGAPRVQGSEVDLGAYESPFTVALEPGAGTPTENDLGAAYPNPFSHRTTLALDLAEAQSVTIEVFDVLGRRVATVHAGPLAVGAHRVVIEAAALPAGVYVVRAEGEAFRFAQRVTLVR